MSISKNIYACLLAAALVCTATAQDKLVIKGKTPNKYVVYKTNGKESLQSISNGFGLTVQKLASYNKINVNANKPFAKGTDIKIPLTEHSLLQHPADNAAAVVHVIGKGENLFRVSQAYHKVPLASLRAWNGLKKDGVKPGQEIIVGYMVNAKPATAADKKGEVKKEEISAATTTVAEQPGPLVVVNATTPPAETPKKTQPVAAPPKETAKNDAPNDASTRAEKPADKKTTVDANGDYVPKEGDEGYFAAAYGEHPKEQTQQFRSGDAAVFKTISGWTDRKFYVLMNDIAPKTIVRITGAANKSICAMVLGPLQETKGANGLTLRISNSAASALGLTSEKFTVTVTYFE